MIAMALAGEPDLLVADEPTTALDATIQAQILELLTTIRRETGMALVLISHDLGVISETCDRVCVMYAGRIIETAGSEALFAQPMHPYTQGLLAALPPLEGVRRRLDPIEGGVPEPWNLPPGCAFAPRCPRRDPACDAAVPSLAEMGADRTAACIHTDAAAGAIHLQAACA
jgi:peptide/nickel transport system ATP-binding protein